MLGLWSAGAGLVSADAVVAPIPLAADFSAVLASPWPAAPALTVTTQLRTAGNGVPSALVRVSGVGTELQVRATWADGWTGAAAWVIDKGEVSLPAWLGCAQTLADGALANAIVAGRVALSGGGTWTGEALSGVVTLVATDVRLDLPDSGVVLDGVTVELVLDLAAQTVRGRVGVKTITAAGFTFADAAIKLRVEASRQLAVESARVGAFGGEISVAPFRLPLDAATVPLVVTLRQIELRDLLSLMPSALKEGRGQVSGEIRGAWQRVGGWKLLGGRLARAPGADVQVRLAESRGFFTSQLPETFTWMPAWFGALARRTAIVNPAYRALSDIEMGRMPLTVEQLDVTLMPVDDPQGRSALVTLRGYPEDRSLVDEVTFDVRVSGPLEQVLKMGLDDRLSLRSAAP